MHSGTRHGIGVSDDTALLPWMLRQDWREHGAAFLSVDMATWPDGLPLAPLPPLPLLGIGPADHAMSVHMDIVEDEAIPTALAINGLRRNPLAASALIDLLRATEGMAADAALICESFCYAMLQAGEEHSAWRDSRPAGWGGPAGTVQARRTDDRLDVWLERPWANNAIDRSMRDALFDAFTLAQIDQSINDINLHGRGKCFSVGADLDEFGTTSDGARAHSIRARTLPARAILARPQIVTVHVKGGCVGSALELIAFAGRIVAQRDAWFQLPEIGMGIIPGAGGCVSVPRRIGRQRAALLMLSGKRISATTALRWGLIDALVGDFASD